MYWYYSLVYTIAVGTCHNCIIINNFITVVALFPVRAYKSKFEFH